MEALYNSIIGSTNKLSLQKTNSYAYYRVSSKNQKDGHSIDQQRDACVNYCKTNNFKLLGEVSEIVSAKNMSNQKNLYNLVNLVCNCNLVIYEPTRLSRNPEDYHRLLKTCETKNITLHFVNPNLISDNNNDKRLISTGVVDGQFESEFISNRVKKSIAYRKSHNKYFPSIPKFGSAYCRISKNNLKVVNNKKEMQIEALIKKLYYGGATKDINNLLVDITGNDKHQLYNPYDPTEVITHVKYGNMRIIDISRFLNSASILRRNKPWNTKSVSDLL
jgi:DNA invertase Pin-like site-specific DNA recombinase